MRSDARRRSEFGLAAVVTALVILMPSAEAAAAIPTVERDALIAVYNSTNGASWTNKTNWLGAAGTECTWNGVTCDGYETTVTRLLLYANHLTGSIPAQIGDLANLEYLDLSDNYGSDSNQITGTIPRELGTLVHLRELRLQQNILSGAIPPELAGLASVTYVDLSDNQLTGAIPTQLGSLPSVQRLFLDSNQLTGSIPTELAALSGLVALYVSGNRLTGAIPPTVGNLTNLQYFGISENQLSGSLPSELGNMAKLQYFQGSNNQLAGPIPPQLGNLTALDGLYLSGNQLTGSIPVELGALPLLRVLWLTSNQLSGGIPAELGNLSTLQYLYLGRNRLTGSIPPQLGSLAGLQRLYVDGNQLTGPIPTALANLTGLVAGQLDLRWNALYSTDAGLTSFLNSKQSGGNWQDTQTVPPAGLSALPTSPTAATVSWTPIAYIGDTGGYRVRASATSGGPYDTLLTTTANKAAAGATVSGLPPGSGTYLVVDTVTNPHAHNPNAVTSETTAEIVVTTPPLPPAPTITGFSPTNGSVGTPVTLTGTNLTAAISVTFNGASATFGVDSATQVSTTVPSGATTGPISVTTPGGTGTSSGDFTVTESPARGFYTLPPCRLVDTRRPIGPYGGPALAAGTARVFALAGQCGIPSTAKAVSLTVTVAQATTLGNLRLYPAGLAIPTVSAINYVSGQTRANNAIAPLNVSGELAAYCAQASGTAHLILDVNGYFAE